MFKNCDPSFPLWNKDMYRGKPFTRVFEFRKLKVINCNVYCTDLYERYNKLVKPILYDVFVQQVAREISPEDYIGLIEFTAEKLSEQLPFTAKGYDKEKFEKLLGEDIITQHILQEVKLHLETLQHNFLH